MSFSGYGASLAGYGSEPTFTRRRARSKTDWAGVSLGCAFNMTLDYYLRREAQVRFYRLCREIQQAAAKASEVSRPEPVVKPQIAPCYTTYPASLAALAAIGLTGFLEFRARAPGRTLANRLKEVLRVPPAAEYADVEPGVYAELAQKTTNAVQIRLLLHALSQTDDMENVEKYRLFAAWHQNLRFRRLAEIIEAVVIYGDVLPPPSVLDLHPVTRQILERVEGVSQSYLGRLDEAAPQELMELGERWVRELLLVLLPHLPRREEARAPNDPPLGRGPGGGLPRGAGAAGRGPRRPLQRTRREPLFRLNKPQPLSGTPERFGPLDGPAPPLLGDPLRPAPAASRRPERQRIGNPSLPPELPGPPEIPGAELVQSIAKQLEGGAPSLTARRLPDSERQILANLSQVLRAACGQTRVTDDMRSDLVQEALRLRAFEASPLQGNPVDGHEVTVHVGENREGVAQIFDRPIELSNRVEELERLLAESAAVTRELKRVLYPDVERVPQTARFCTSGALDGGRLAVAAVSDAIYKRSRHKERPDPRGRPLLLLVCDGSGSLQASQMGMVKILAASWLASTEKTSVQVLAALYHAGAISRGVSGPLIEWIHHPEKTPAASRRDAIRAVAALPPKGSGGQADAPTLQFLLEEARRLSRGRSIYLVLISDTKWIKSVGGESGYAEVRVVLEKAIQQLKERLHVTLVALGVDGKTGFEDVVDAVVRVSGKEITDISSVAKRIALYVARCMRERRKLCERLD